ncbi:MAG: prepilin-type N-terminal cleavage/methylation domain-containing protein [Bacteroidia bacterium]|nr:prepilin-type N-terminal cleavage/methylation domain-containing protein [Bacteroidia bacterium]
MKGIKKYQKGFTIAEVLITLVLTSIAITLSYGTLNYIQKLFHAYTNQNKYINQITDLKQRLDFEAIKCDLVVEESENNFRIVRDTIESHLIITDKNILYKRQLNCDTFNIEAINLKKEYERIENPKWHNLLIKSLQFESSFTKQKFNFYFYKEYDAATKLALESTE